MTIHDTHTHPHTLTHRENFSDGLTKLEAHPLTNYTMIERENQPEEDPSVAARLHRLSDHYNTTGVRRGVEAVMVVMDHGFPHILVLQVANAFYKLPGGYLDPSETDQEGLLTRLDECLGVPNGEGGYIKPAHGDWQVAECLSIWWRPNLDTFAYPYLPPHVSYPKECKKLYLVTLPKHKGFAVPTNMKLHAVPIYEFYDNASRYGPQFAGLPYLLSKYWLPHHEHILDCADTPDGTAIKASKGVYTAKDTQRDQREVLST